MKIWSNAKRTYEQMSIVTKATLWFVICSVLQKGIAVLTTPIFTRLMTTEQYGQFSIYSSWLQVITIFTTLRLNGAVFNKGMSKYKDDRDSYTATMQTVTLFSTIICFLIYIVFRRQINNLTELPTVIMVAMFLDLLFIPAIDYWTVKKRYEYLYIPVVVRTLLMAGLNAVIGIGSVWLLPEKGYARIISCVVVDVCFGIWLFVYNYKKSRRRLVKEYAIFAIRFNAPLLVHYISQYILDQFDRIMVQKMVGIAAAGVYSVAYGVGLLLRIITTSINNALVPWQYEKLEKKNYKELDDVMFFVFCIVAACSIVLSCLAPEVMHILAGEAYYEGVYVIPPVALGLFFSFMYTLYANIEFYFEKTKFSMYISLGGAILNIILNYIGIKFFGYIAAAYTTLICYLLFAIGHYIYTISCVKKSSKDQEYSFRAVRLIGLSISVLVFCVIFTYLYDSIFVRYGIILTLFLALLSQRKRIKKTMFAIKSN